MNSKILVEAVTVIWHCKIKSAQYFTHINSAISLYVTLCNVTYVLMNKFSEYIENVNVVLPALNIAKTIAYLYIFLLKLLILESLQHTLLQDQNTTGTHIKWKA